MTTPTDPTHPADPHPPAGCVTLQDGRQITLRQPLAGELRGLKLIDVLQLDTAAHAVLLERISDLSALQFLALPAPDAMALMTEAIGFFAPATGAPYPSTSKTPMP